MQQKSITGQETIMAFWWSEKFISLKQKGSTFNGEMHKKKKKNKSWNDDVEVHNEEKRKSCTEKH